MEDQKTTGGLEIDAQAGFFGMFRASHLSLPSHAGNTLEDCPVCKVWFISNKNLTGKPLESFRIVFIDFSEYNGESNIQYVNQKSNEYSTSNQKDKG